MNLLVLIRRMVPHCQVKRDNYYIVLTLIALVMKMLTYKIIFQGTTSDKLNFTGSDRLQTSTSEGLSQTSNISSASHNYSNTVEPVSSTDTAQELVFESIPEPPTVPTPVDEVTGAILGEPTLTSLGLGGWSPSGIVQQCLEFFHVNMGMPWWASILTGTIIVRLLVFPLVVKSQRNAAKMQNNMPELQVLQMKMTEARQTGNALLG